MPRIIAIFLTLLFFLTGEVFAHAVSRSNTLASLRISELSGEKFPNKLIDAEGRRVKKHIIELRNGATVAEKTITFVWDGWDLLYERHQLPSGLTTLQRKYLWGPDIADGAAGGAGGLLLIQETKGNTTIELIPLYDGTGHITALTNLNKDLLAAYTYGPFGEKIQATGPRANSNPWRYATKYLDEETGLYYFGMRYYDPITGQWLSREPLGEEESLNLYSYCHNDPINKVDVLGLREYAIRNPENPIIKVNGVWHRNMIMNHEATWMWQTSRGILPGTEHVGRKAGPLDFNGLVQVGDKWVIASENASFTKGFSNLGWNADSKAELTTLAPVAMATPIIAAYTIAAAPTVASWALSNPVSVMNYTETAVLTVAGIKGIYGVPNVASAATKAAKSVVNTTSIINQVENYGAHLGPRELQFLDDLAVRSPSLPSIVNMSAKTEGDDLVSLFRAVEPEEFFDIMNTGDFRTASRVIDGVEYTNTTLPKQFGFVFDEVLSLADTTALQKTVAIIETKVPRNLLYILDLTPVDQSILRNGSVTVPNDILDLFNRLKTRPTHKY